MSAKPHLPGPWRVEPKAPLAVTDDAGRLLAVSCGISDIADYCEANARLIAAAPELLDALAECVDQHVNGIAGISKACIKRARAAIAKAKGAA